MKKERGSRMKHRWRRDPFKFLLPSSCSGSFSLRTRITPSSVILESSHSKWSRDDVTDADLTLKLWGHKQFQISCGLQRNVVFHWDNGDGLIRTVSLKLSKLFFFDASNYSWKLNLKFCVYIVTIPSSTLTKKIQVYDFSRKFHFLCVLTFHDISVTIIPA
jgi:hypothetical protein